MYLVLPILCCSSFQCSRLERCREITRASFFLDTSPCLGIQNKLQCVQRGTPLTSSFYLVRVYRYCPCQFAETVYDATHDYRANITVLVQCYHRCVSVCSYRMTSIFLNNPRVISSGTVLLQEVILSDSGCVLPLNKTSG